MSPMEWRAVERIVALLAGVLLAYLGYRLFTKMPERADGEGRITLPGDVSVYVSRIGPGGFFGIFGTSIIIASFYFGLTLQGPLPIEPNVVSGTGIYYNHYLGGAGTTADQDRTNLAGDIYMLNQVLPALRHEANDLDLEDLEQALYRIRLSLLWSVWDNEHWGDYEGFRKWINEGAVQPTPSAFATPFDIFRRAPMLNTQRSAQP